MFQIRSGPRPLDGFFDPWGPSRLEVDPISLLLFGESGRGSSPRTYLNNVSA
jgi:hypothetical protein